MNRPTSIVLDGDGHLFIVDSENHRIIRSISNGFECLFGCSGKSGASASELNHPQMMAFDKDGNIFVTDLNNHRIQMFNLIQNSYATIAATRTTSTTPTSTAHMATVACKFCAVSSYLSSCSSCTATNGGCTIRCDCRNGPGSSQSTSITISPGPGNGCNLQNKNGVLECESYCS